jgi:hypothetical protein
VSAAELRGAATDVLAEPGFRERARALAAALRSGGGYARAADRIVALALADR